MLSVSPGAGQLGAAGITLAVAGSSTHFTTSSTVTLTLTQTGPPPAVTTINQIAGSTVLIDGTHISAQFNIPAGVPLGAYTVTARTGTETAVLPGGFLVATAGPLSLSSIAPNSLAAGLGSPVNVVGVNTHFVQDTTIAAFGDGITVGPVTVTDSTHASFFISIDPIARLGARTLTMATGGEYATGGFTITNNGSTLTTVGKTLPAPACASGCSGPQGTNATLSLTGLGTHWIQAGTSVSVGGGVNVGNIIVTGQTQLTANISIGPGVAVGSYPVTVTTNGEIVTQANAFSVTAATPYLSSVAPNVGAQGQTLDVTFTGVFTHFTTPPLTANFGPNITVNSITPATDLTATANISIANTAFAGGRTGILSSNGTDYRFTFTVSKSNTALISVVPNSGLQGASVALQVLSANTHWVQGLTFASLGSGIVVNRVVINSATTAEVDITIPTNASVGLTSLTMSTGGEIVTLGGAFTVLPYTPTLTMSPSSGMIAVAPATTNTVSVNFNGNFTHFVPNETIAVIDGNGVSIQNFKVLNAWNATAQFVINATAPASPSLLCNNIYGGNRIVTLETPMATGSEIVRTGFCVTSTPAVLTSISPYHSPKPVNNLAVTITGRYTHFEAGVTSVGFGPNITVIPGSIIVGGPTSLTATINISDDAVLGWRPVFVNTVDAANSINEQLTIGFAIDPPATSTLLSVLPNTGIQGQSLTVQITGNLTNWATGSTIPIFGEGIAVNSLTVNGPASATAQISIDPVNSPVGGSSVTMVTQLASGNQEVVSGPLFSVTQGTASISTAGQQGNELAVHAPIYQGSIISFAVTGHTTHFLQGETTLDFGSDIAVSQLVVDDATHLHCQIAVTYTATIGYRGFRAITNAEVAPSFSDALNILAVQGSSVNITPTSGRQGTTFTVQVNGTNTHWTGSAANPVNNTIASFGNNNGVNVTAINVISPTQMNLTVQVLGTAAVTAPWTPGYPYTLTITTTGLPIGPAPMSPQSTEELVLRNILSIGPGAGIITLVTPNGGPQSSTAPITVVGQNTSFQTGVTTAYFSTGGCYPAYSAGINVSNVTAIDHTHATLAIAVSATAPTGYQTLCMYTQGEIVSYSNAFQVTPGNPTLNSVTVTGPAPATGTSGQQGQTVNVEILGQFTHWGRETTVTFGQGITVTDLTITGSSSATATLIIDGSAYIGSRTTTVTTGNEIVSGNYFNVTQSAAIISSISPTSANQGQHIQLTINGNFTHWSQGLTQFSISGGGYDITVNGVVINSPTQAVADLTITNISGNNGLGTRSIYMSTVGENVNLQSGFLITGGVPSIVSVSPGYGTRGNTARNVLITGQFTHWDATTVMDFGDPAISVLPTSTINSNTSITAVIDIGAGATLGVHTVTVRTGVSPDFSTQLAQFTVYNPAAPPTPYISYESPSTALVGQTLAVRFSGAYTNWLPGQTTIDFGAGIQVNTVALQQFDITSLTTGVANITILPGATVGPRTVRITTGSQQLTTTFYVTVGTPAITLVSTNSASQGETRLLDLVGQYTTWNATTQFTFCAGITSVTDVQLFGPTAARLQVTVNPLASTGYCPVAATTGTEVANLGGGGYFYITPSTAVISNVTPNTALQNATGVVVNVVGFATLWTPTTVFNFGSGVGITSQNVIDNTHATLTLSLDLYASPGMRNLTATTGGQVATLHNAFVVQPGTPILLSATNGSNQQQAEFHLGILGQYTKWTPANTTVTFPSGGVTGVVVNVTGEQSITVTGTILPTAYTGCGSIVVTTTGQIPPVLTLYGFCITRGPAAITQLVPNTLGQGETANVAITGTNTNWAHGITVGNFGAGISVNTLTVNSATSATANVTVAANATPAANTVSLTTAGELATDVSAMTIYATTPTIPTVFPNSATQGQSLDVCITATFTHFVNGNTTADFGPGITVNSTTVAPTATCPTGDATHATVNITIAPTALTSGNTNHVRMITNLASPPGAQEIAVWQNSSATTQYNFAVAKGSATILSATPFAPATVHQNDNGDIIHIVGSGTHFTVVSPTVSFCSGVSNVGLTVVDDTHITSTVNLATWAPVGACSVTVTTGGEVATNAAAFNILAGLPAITSVSPTSARQNEGVPTPLSVTINGLFTHFLSGALSVTFPAGVTVVTGPSASSDTALTVGIQVDPAAALGLGSVTVSDTTDGPVTRTNAFTVNAGVPAIFSVSPNTGPQGSTQTITITGNYTAWTAASTVSLSGGSDVTVGACCTLTNLPNGYQQTLAVPFTVTDGAAATNRTVYVTTASQQLYLSNAFTVLPGVTTIRTISPNIGVNGVVNLTVNITGAFTHFAGGSTTANFGAGISVNGFAEGTPGTIVVNSATSATATLAINASQAIAPLGTRNVTITDPTDGSITVTDGFTVQTTDTTAPSIIYVSPTDSATGVPINTKLSVVFSEPMNPATLTSANVTVSDNTVYNGCAPPIANTLEQNAGGPTLDASGRILTVRLNNLLPVGRGFRLTVNNSNAPSGSPIVSDQSGNHLSYNRCYGFTAGFAADSVGPAFVAANMAPGATGVPTNSPVILGFDKPINPGTIPAGLSVTQGGSPVAGTWGYSSDFMQATFSPASNLAATTTYTVTYGVAITDTVGSPLTNPNHFDFTTGAATVTGGSSVVSQTPQSGSTTGLNPTIRLTFNRPINPLTVNASTFYIANYQDSATVLGTTISHSPDNKTFTLSLPGPLLPSTRYHVYAYTFYDWANNSTCCTNWLFYTGAAATSDTTAPSVTSVSPVGGAVNVPVNPVVYTHFTEALDPTQLGNITLTPAAAGATAFVSGDYSTVTFTPSGSLATSTAYTINVTGFADVNGNSMAAYAGSVFTTGATATPDTTHGSITATPTSGATNVPVNTQVVLTLTKPVNPVTVNSTSFGVYDNTGGAWVPGTTTISSDDLTLTFSVTGQYQAGHQYCIRASYNDYFYDLAGNYFNNRYQCFTAGATADTTLPTVSASPSGGVTGIGPTNPVVLTFSKSMNSGTLNRNVAIYAGSTLYTSSYSLSGDNTTVVFSTSSLPFSTTFTIVVNPEVTDLAGNHLAASYSTTFTTAPQPLVARPSVTAMRPDSGATGVPVSQPITFFMSAPMNAATLTASTLKVSQNGVLVTGGSIAVTGNNQGVAYTPPAGGFTPGALVQVFLTSGAQDSNGNLLYSYQSQFSAAPDVSGVGPSPVSYFPCRNCSGNSTTTVVDILFNKPLNPATLTGNFYLKDSGDHVVPASAAVLLNGGRLLRIKPTNPLPPSTYYYVWVTNGIQDLAGHAAVLPGSPAPATYNYYFYTNTTANAAAPFVTASAPTNLATGIGTNAVVSVTFSGPLDSNTIDPATVTLSGGGAIPLSTSYDANSLTMTVTPMAPLPPSTLITLTLNGIADRDGHALNPTPYQLQFTTGAGPDFSAPVVTQTNIVNNQTGVPVTSNFTLTFNEPLDWRSVNYGIGNSLYLRDTTDSSTVAATVTPVGSNGILITPIAPNYPLNVNRRYQLYGCGIADLNGNVGGCYHFNIYFTTALTAPSGGPVVTQMIPPAGATTPTNFQPQVKFDRPLNPATLGGATLTQGATPVPATPVLTSGGTILTLVPNALLSPGLAYTFTVAGLQDPAGNTQTGSSVRNFTTGQSFDLASPALTSITPINNTTTGVNPLIRFTFNETLNPIQSDSFVLRNYPNGPAVYLAALDWAPDFKSVTFTYPSPLDPNSRYQWYISTITDLAGNTSGACCYYFYTGNGTDATPETVSSVTPPNGQGGVPLNAVITLKLAKAASPGSITNSSVTLATLPGPVTVAGTAVQLSSDGLTLTLTHANLTASTNYAITVPAGAFTDQNGNAVSAFSSSFTTGTSTDTVRGTISMSNPSPATLGTPLNQTITVTFSKPLNPNSLVGDYFVVRRNQDGNYPVAGTITNPTPNTLLFTPSVALPANTRIDVYVGYWDSVKDLAGNDFNYLYDAYFTTASAADATPPQVTSVRPANGATGVGPYAPVSISFNKSLDYSTINSANFALYRGAELVSASVSYSSDRSVVYLSTTLGYSANYTVAISTNVKDYNGNYMAPSCAAPLTAACTYNFTTLAQPLTSNPSVTQMRPGNGAATTIPITLYLNSPMNHGSVQDGVTIFVAQNGALIPGSVSFTADSQGIIWTPSGGAFLPGALVEIFLYSPAADTSGNVVNSYSASFHTAAQPPAASTPPVEVAFGPCKNCTMSAPAIQPIIEIQFSKPINCSTVTNDGTVAGSSFYALRTC